MKTRSAEDLVKLLGHKDQRIRLEAQWELAGRPEATGQIYDLVNKDGDLIPRVHAMMALGQLVRAGATNAESIWKNLALNDSKVPAWSRQQKMPESLRVQLIRAWEIPDRGPTRGELNKWLIRQLAKTEAPAVRAAAAFSLMKNGDLPAVEALL
jgi:hypothetical protein